MWPTRRVEAEHLNGGDFLNMNSSEVRAFVETMNYDDTVHDSPISITSENYTINVDHGNSSAKYDLAIPLYIYILGSIFNSVIFCAGIAGNILVIIVILKVKHLRTPMNMFLLNLSVADILVLLICQPAGLLEFFGKDRWFLGKIMCK